MFAHSRKYFPQTHTPKNVWGSLFSHPYIG